MPSFVESEGVDDPTEVSTCPFCTNRTVTSSSHVPTDHVHHRRDPMAPKRKRRPY